MELPTVPKAPDADLGLNDPKPFFFFFFSQEAKIFQGVRVEKTGMIMSTTLDFRKQCGIFQKDLYDAQGMVPRVWCILDRSHTSHPRLAILNEEVREPSEDDSG